jgi:serine protease AprX
VNIQNVMKIVRSRSLSLVIILALVLTPFALVIDDANAAETIDPNKVDQAFNDELEADDGSLYYDVVVVFREKSDVSLLDTFSRSVKTFNVLPMGRILLNKSEITEVTQWSEVLFVEPNRQLETFNSEGRVLTRSEEVQKDLGYSGNGVEVAIIDTGTDGTHPDLDDNMLYNWQVVGDFNGGTGYVSSTVDGIDVQTDLIDATLEAGGPTNTDEYGHGTHVFGTIAGTGEASEGHYRGMAPSANVHSYSTSTGIFLVFTLEAYDHIMSSNEKDVANIKVVSNSWGSSGCEFEPFRSTNIATRMAYEQGILSVFAYGNSGPSPDTCNPYATAPYVLGIAATDKSHKITGFSSRGKLDGNYDREAALTNLNEFLAATLDEQANWDYSTKPIGLYRPSVAAPGQDIVSAQNPLHPMTLSGTRYGSASGTSMATPHVSGIMALILEAYQVNHPDKTLTPIDLLRLTEVTANKDVMFGFDTHDTGAGFVDAYTAVERAVQNDIPLAVTEEDLVNYEPPATVKIDSGTYSGTVLVDSWQTDIGYGLHEIDVQEGALKVYADVSWASEVEKVYISLFAPGLDVENDDPTVISAGLLDVTNKRFVEFNFPEPGTWKVRIDGRINIATDYDGKWEVHYPDNAYPTGSIEATPDKVDGNEPIDFKATVNDPDGIADLTKVTVVVRASNGKVIGSWEKSDFTSVDDKTLELVVTDFDLHGKAPWTVELKAEDSAGHKIYDQDFVGRK